MKATAKKPPSSRSRAKLPAKARAWPSGLDKEYNIDEIWAEAPEEVREAFYRCRASLNKWGKTSNSLTHLQQEWQNLWTKVLAIRLVGGTVPDKLALTHLEVNENYLLTKILESQEYKTMLSNQHDLALAVLKARGVHINRSLLED